MRSLLPSQRGFTLIELMVTVAIVGVLAAIALPSYQNYVRRAYYSEVISSTASYRAAVGECVLDLGTLSGCDAGTNHIPNAVTTPVGAVAGISVANGIITVIPVAVHGILATDTYVLTPTMSANGIVTWVASGGGVANGYAQ